MKAKLAPRWPSFIFFSLDALFAMDIRSHATKAVDYSIRVAWVSIIAVPLWFCVWWGLGSPIGEPGLNPQGDFWADIVGRIGFAFLSPGYAVVKLLRFLHIPSFFGLLDFVLAVVVVPAFWGTAIYCFVQLYRHIRL